MRALITGAGGFVGIHLARHLAEREIAVTGIVRSRDGLPPGCQTLRCDLTHRQRLAEAVNAARPDRVYHLAALSRPDLSWRNPVDFYRVNVLGTIHLLDAIRKLDHPCRTLVVSSGAVYGARRDNRPLFESDSTEARDPYASSKILMEAVAFDYFRVFAIPIVVARPFNHCGPGQRRGFVVADFCSQAALIEQGKQKGPLQTGDLNVVRDFLDVRDVARAYCGLMDKGEPGEAYNVCSGKAVPLSSLLETVRENARVAFRINSKEGSAASSDVRIGNGGKLARTIRFERRYDLSETIGETLDFWRAAVR